GGERIEEGRGWLEGIAQDLKLDAHAYVDLGLMIIMRVTPPPAPLGLFGLLGPAPPKLTPPADTPWTRLASELLDRAVALRPDDIALYKQLVGELMLSRADLARRYAEAAVRLLPDDPDVWILLGLDDQVREAKTTLQRAAQLARKQGKRELARQAQEMRSAVGTPMFHAGIQMSIMSMQMGGLDENFDLDDIESFL